MQNVLCKGSLVAGTGCGKCQRCVDSVPRFVERHKKLVERETLLRDVVDSAIKRAEMSMTLGISTDNCWKTFSQDVQSVYNK